MTLTLEALIEMHEAMAKSYRERATVADKWVDGSPVAWAAHHMDIANARAHEAAAQALRARMEKEKTDAR